MGVLEAVDAAEEEPGNRGRQGDRDGADEAREALERALALWERKGCLPCAQQRIRDQIALLGRPTV